MSNGEWTKGEWMALEDDDNSYGVLSITTESRLSDGYCEIVKIDTGFVGPIGIEQKANALLIAAAPELYEALDNLVGYLETGDIKRLDMNMARNAMAKARGE